MEKGATPAQIKKAYRKLALKLHPDKNPYPKATDAFKKVSAAFATLSDEDKRRTYDHVGHSENFEQEYEQRQNRNRHYEEEIDPFDLFEAFFSGGNIHRGQRRA